jgi:cytochrome c-type biogenesis protein CcsB
MNALNLVQIETLAAGLTFMAAGFSMICFLLQMAFDNDRFKAIGQGGMAVALIGATVTLVARTFIARHVPWSNLWESVIFLLFATLAFYFLVEFWYKPRYFGVVAAPLALILIGGASILPAGLKSAEPLVPALQSYWIEIHTSAILASYAAFTMAFAAAAAYLIIDLRARQLATAEAAGPVAPGGDTLVFMQAGAGTASFTPARAAGPTSKALTGQLALFDELTYRLILFGFPLLMFGIITGGIWANEVWGTYWSWDPKETWALITWFIYAAYLHARIQHDWTGRRAAALSVGGFVSMGICYLGVNFLSSGLHSYGFLR